jgi:hypothetical protein
LQNQQTFPVIYKNASVSKHYFNIIARVPSRIIWENETLPMVFLLSQQQNTAMRNTSDPTVQIRAIMTTTPSKPNTLNGFIGCGSGGGTGQLASQSTQLQAGTSGWKKNT